MEKFSIHLVWSDRLSGYQAFIPELPEAVSGRKGAGAQQAVQDVLESAETIVMEKQDAGDPVPGSARLEDYSGQFRLRIPRTLHAGLAREAARQGMSLNSYVMHLLSSRFSREQTWREMARVVDSQMRHTMYEMQEMVSSITLGEPYMEKIMWHGSEIENCIITQ